MSAQDGMQSTPLRWHFAARLMLAVGLFRGQVREKWQHSRDVKWIEVEERWQMKSDW